MDGRDINVSTLTATNVPFRLNDLYLELKINDLIICTATRQNTHTACKPRQASPCVTSNDARLSSGKGRPQVQRLPEEMEYKQDGIEMDVMLGNLHLYMIGTKMLQTLGITCHWPETSP